MVGRLVAECTSNAKHGRQGRDFEGTGRVAESAPFPPPPPSSVTFAQVVESGGTKRWARAERSGGQGRGEERREGDEQEGSQPPCRTRGEENGEAEGEGPGRGHPPPPPSHSPAHPDYPQPGAGHTVMSIRRGAQLPPRPRPRPVFPFREKKNIPLSSSIRKFELKVDLRNCVT